MANKKQGRTVTVCVVGLSGYDISKRCLYGVGKSCLCNRFVRPAEDDYFSLQHTSIFSTSDFGGSVLNNDHFLYWGSVEKTFDDNTTVNFKVIEQTEFIDDASYTPLSKGGQIKLYYKRATETKVSSPGKIMYISRDQVALQNDYEQKRMDQDGKLSIDAFICCYDVSHLLPEDQNQTDYQERILTDILNNIQKTKKPVIVVATKCDEGSEQLLQRAHQFVQGRKIMIPLVETSAEKFINIDLGFHTLVQMIDTKNRYRTKLIPFKEGLTLRNSHSKKLTESYLKLVKSAANDSTLLMSWGDFKKKYMNLAIYKELVFECGSDKAMELFNQQAKKIKRHFEDKKLNEYLNKLPEYLDELLPSLQSITSNNEVKWENSQQAIKNHILFDKWFQVLPKHLTWNTPEQLFETNDGRIPFDVLQLERSRACFDRHIKKLKISARKMEMKSEFREILESTTAIRPGTSWLDAIQLLSVEKSFNYLDESDRKSIFETYLQDITYIAKLDFQELLFESASKFYKLSKEVRPSINEMKNIYDYLQDDERYKNLEYIGNARDILLFNHIALMQSPNRCLSGPNKCMDRLMQQVVEVTGRRNNLNPYENDLFQDNEDEQINVLVIGLRSLALQLQDKIRDESSSCDSLEYMVDGQIYGLNLKVFDEIEFEDEDSLSKFISKFKPQGFLTIYSNNESLKFAQDCLQKIQKHDVTSQVSLPLNIIMANQSGLPDDEIDTLRNEGRNLANMMDCVFVDYPYTVSLMDDPIHDSQVQDAIRGIVDVINKRIRPPSTPTGGVKVLADIRLLLVAMCGDEYPVELILGTMLQPHTCYSSPDQQDTIMMEVLLNGTKKTISVTLASYHRAYSLKSQLFHGYILAYSATRLASLETLRAFASSLPQVPVQVLAVTGSSSGASIVFHEEDALFLFNESICGNLSTKFSAKFQNNQKQAGAFLSFFNTVHNRRINTELTIQGIKTRRQGPLPDVPALEQLNSCDNTYSIIDPDKPATLDSPYTEVALRRSYIQESDSSPSSPDHHRKTIVSRSRSSTVESRDDLFHNNDIQHDETGLYALVDKRAKLTYIKTFDKYSEDDDDDDMIWQDNMAYDSTTNMVTPHPSLSSPRCHDRPYATVPFLPKGHRSMVNDFNKFATLPADTKKFEPNYASIDQIRSQMVSRGDTGYEPDSLSSISSKSKESTGSQSDLLEVKSNSKKSPLPSPIGQNPMFYLHEDQANWTPTGSKLNDRSAAPLAKPDDDENEDIKELRQNLEDNLSTTAKTTNKKKSYSRRDSPNKSDNNSFRKTRSESNNSANSLDPRNMTILKKMIRKVSPHPSPGNSDIENEVPVETPNPIKKRRNQSLRKRKQSPAPTVIINDEDSNQIKDRSNTLPTSDSPKTSHKFSSLDNRKQKSFIFKKFTSEFPDVTLNNPAEHEKFTTQTLDRKKIKKLKEQKKQISKDDLDLPLADSNAATSTMEKRKEKKQRKAITMSFKNMRPYKRETDQKKKLQEFERQKAKKQKFKDSNYFGQPLAKICPEGTLCPVFVEKIINHVEGYGMESEGLYRQSGNKNVIEAIMQKFEANNAINLHELGVSVHAITGAFKQFLNLLPEPLIPYEISSSINKIMIIMDAAERLKEVKLLVDQLPPHNLEIFKKFTCHLYRVTKFKQVNKMDVRNLQTVLYPTLMRASFDSLTNISQNMNMGLFIQTCIEQVKTIFNYEVVEDEESKSLTKSLSQTADDVEMLKVNGESSELNCELEDGKNVTHDEKQLIIKKASNELSFKIASNDDISFTDSVLKDPGVEIIINSPQVEHEHIEVNQDNNLNKPDKKIVGSGDESIEVNLAYQLKVKNVNRKSIETAID